MPNDNIKSGERGVSSCGLFRCMVRLAGLEKGIPLVYIKGNSVRRDNKIRFVNILISVLNEGTIYG
jgi:hypothetical protein